MSGILHVEDDSQQDAVQVSGDGRIPANNGIPIIKVIGDGGGGGSTVQHMIDENVQGVDFIAVNTDLQALNNNSAPTRIQIGLNTTRGLGSGSNPAVGCQAAEESREDLKNSIGESDIVFITAGMGGGTGTGASPVIAQLARKDLKALTVAIVTTPFSFEGKKQMMKALEGIEKLRDEVDALIIVPNDKLLKNLPKNISLISAFQECNRVLMRAVEGISGVILKDGFINLDFNDIRTFLQKSGPALIGMGAASGEGAIIKALDAAINCPLLEDVAGCKARGVIVNLNVSPSFPLQDLNTAGDSIQAYYGDDADVKYGITYDNELKDDEVKITVVMAGLTRSENSEAPAQAKEAPQVQEQVAPASVESASTNSIFGSFKREEDEEPAPQVSVKNTTNAFEGGKITLPSFLSKRSK